jgi:membrane protein DedA with SNARE-associated domain
MRRGPQRRGTGHDVRTAPRTSPIETLIAEYGLPAIFLGAGLEGETVAILAGVIAHAGTLGFWPVVLAVALGSFVADQIWFACGRYFRGSRLVRRISARPFFAKALTAFERRPVLFTFGFRFVYGFRTVSPIAIGTTQLSTARFVLINAAAAATWALVFVSAGYWFGNAIESVFGTLRSNHRLLVGAAGALLLVGALAFWTRRKWLPDGL